MLTFDVNATTAVDRARSMCRTKGTKLALERGCTGTLSPVWLSERTLADVLLASRAPPYGLPPELARLLTELNEAMARADRCLPAINISSKIVMPATLRAIAAPRLALGPRSLSERNSGQKDRDVRSSGGA
jgi:hypothetical protein